MNSYTTLHYTTLKDMCSVENLQATDSFSRRFNTVLIDQRQYTVLTGHIKVTYLVLIGPQAVTMFMGAVILKCHFGFIVALRPVL